MLSWLFGKSSPPPMEPEPALWMRSDDPEVRKKAAEAMGGIAEMWSVSALLKMLTDASTPVREAARASLVKLGPAAVEGLLEGLNHSNTDLGKSCADILGDIADLKSINHLIVTLKYGARPVQLACRRALEKIGPPAKADLEAARGETQPWVREQIEGILNKLGS